VRVAFTDIDNLGWTAGAHYYTNLFHALRSLPDAPTIVVADRPGGAPGGYDTYRVLADEVITLPELPPKLFADRVKGRLGFAPPRPPAEGALQAAAADVVFACWRAFGADFAVPTLGWIPDFQHHHHPELFPDEELADRNALFTAMAAQCTRIVLSSEDARRDFERFHPEHADKARVLRFVARVPDGVTDADPAGVCAEYHLPERFVYLPNQFWQHKNHEVVLEALARLRSTRPEITVVCTGNTADNRHPLHFGELLARASRLGVRESFVVLGWVRHADTFRLLRQSLAVLQPSRFEGWSTTVEETKSIGKGIVLSDLPIHREQDPPGVRWFDPTDPADLADRLVEVYDTAAPGPDGALEQAARDALPGRIREYGETFVAIARDAVAARSTP